MTRTMHPAMAEWLDGLTTSDRRVLLALADEKAGEIQRGETDSLTAWLLVAVRAEILMLEARDAQTLRDLEADDRAEVDAAAERLNLPVVPWAEFSSPNLHPGDMDGPTFA